MSGLSSVFAVLMVGHSLFGPTGPVMLERALLAGAGDAEVRAQIINGAPLSYNWDNGASAEGVDARAVLPEGQTTHLILTEAIPLENHLKWSATHATAQAYASLAYATDPETKVYVQETWHSLKSGTGVSVQYDDNADIPWRTRLDQDLPKWQSIVTAMAENPSAPGQTVALIPAGQAMALLHDEIEQGAVPGLTSISALFDDDIHLSHTGHFFVSMVQYATLTGEDPTGLPVPASNGRGQSFDTPDTELALRLQEVAWEAVQTYQSTQAVTLTPERAPLQRVAARPTGPPDTPLPDLTQPQPNAVPGRRDIAIGLAPVTDWGTQQPFINILKTARPWIGHKPAQWGGMSAQEMASAGHLDTDGWPIRMPPGLSSIGTLILTDMPPEARSLAGQYELSFTGTGIIEVGGRATNIRYAPGKVRFDYTPGPGSVDIRLQRIDPAYPLRITSVVHEDHIAAFAAGARFNPRWTDRISGFRALRFMDWMATNNATLSLWSDRPLPDDVTFADGVPVEVMVDLANQLQRDAWFTLPHLADYAFMQAFAMLVRDRLDPKLKVYVEFSNEVWNWQFEQARWAEAQGLARWGENEKWMQFYGLRAAEVARIWTDVFADARPDRLINVISSQTGWLGLETEALEAPLAVTNGQPAPVTAFDAYAITGYFGGILGGETGVAMVKGWLADSLVMARLDAQDQGLSGDAAAAYIDTHRYDHATAMAFRQLYDGGVTGDAADTLADLITRVWPHHAAVARAHDLDLIMYEGGTHIVAHGAPIDDAALTDFFHHLNYTAEMGALYETLLKGWQANGGQLFNAYADVYRPVKWGSWGALRHLDDDNPRWDALVNFQ